MARLRWKSLGSIRSDDVCVWELPLQVSQLHFKRSFFSSEPPGKSFFSYYVLKMSIFSCFIDHLYFVFCIKFTDIFCPFLCSAVWFFLYWFVDILYTFQRQILCLWNVLQKSSPSLFVFYLHLWYFYVIQKFSFSIFMYQINLSVFPFIFVFLNKLFLRFYNTCKHLGL